MGRPGPDFTAPAPPMRAPPSPPRPCLPRSPAVKVSGLVQGIAGNERSTPRFPSVARPRGRVLILKAGNAKCVAATEICQFYQGLTYSRRNRPLDPKAEG
jgi:hypothetical protein